MQNKLFSKKTYIKRNVDYVVKTTGLDLKSESQNNSAKTYKYTLENSNGIFFKACDDIICFF